MIIAHPSQLTIFQFFTKHFKLILVPPPNLYRCNLNYKNYKAEWFPDANFPKSL